MWFDCCEKLVSNLCDKHAHVEEEDDKAAIGGEVLRDHLVDIHSVVWLVLIVNTSVFFVPKSRSLHSRIISLLPRSKNRI